MIYSCLFGKKGVKMILEKFRFWCQKVLPLVYDDSLSYYEVLCKVVEYINNLIEQDKVFVDDIAELKTELAQVQEWIDNFDTAFAEEIIKKYIATMIFVEINNSGYIVYNIPQSWNDIKFNTTGKDVLIDGIENGTLVLSY